jgi:hypothetical protein
MDGTSDQKVHADRGDEQFHVGECTPSVENQRHANDCGKRKMNVPGPVEQEVQRDGERQKEDNKIE